MRFDDAILILQAEVREHPGADDARLLLARVLSWRRRYPESLEQYRALLERKPKDATIRAGYARVLAWSGRHEEAIREFQTAIAADSTNLETRIGYARVLAWSGDLAGASVEYDRILAKNPRSGDAWLGLASVSRWRGAPTAADRFAIEAQQYGADAEGLTEEQHAIEAALASSLGGGWSASKERQYVEGPDFILETEGPYVAGRATASRSVGISGRIAWLSLLETPASGGVPNYDLTSVDTRVDLSLARGYPWGATVGAQYMTFEQDGPATYLLGEDDDFFGFGGRVWRHTGRFTPRASIRRDYIALRDTVGGLPTFVPGHVDQYEAGSAWQWSGRGSLDALVSRGVYSDDNRRWTAAGSASYRVKTNVPNVTLGGSLQFRDWDFQSPNYFTPLSSVRGAASALVSGYIERPAVDYGIRYEFSGLGSSNFEDIWAHAWSGWFNVTAADRIPVGVEAAYSVDNNSYETWFLGLSATARW
jgi:Tfp pilus assembly protein PilF